MSCVFQYCGRFRLLCAVCFLAVLNGTVDLAESADVISQIGAGGVGRYKAGRWGMLQGKFSNPTDADETVTVVVTPEGPSDARYVRSIVVPPRTICSSVWPVFVESGGKDSFKFNVLLLEGDDTSQQITKLNSGDLMNDFISSNAQGSTAKSPGYCGLLRKFEATTDEADVTQLMMTRLRSNADLVPMVAMCGPSEIRTYPEALEPLDQLIVTSSELQHAPETCDAVRTWIQRGGRALILLEKCGEESARALLGDALPLTVVDQTTPLRVSLKHELPDPRKDVASLSHVREFVEPVTMVRTIFEGALVHWSVEGWPLLVEVPLGGGTVFVLTMSPEILSSGEDNQSLDSCASPIMDRMFLVGAKAPLLTVPQLTKMSEQQIGYQIPGRSFAALVLVFFTTALTIVGAIAWKRDQPAMLMAVPILAVVAALPGLWKGSVTRNAVPSTLVEFRVAQASPGQSNLGADGVSTIFHPDVVSSSLQLAEHSLIQCRPGTPAVSGQRFVWTGLGEARRSGFAQPAGATTYQQRSRIQLPTPLSAVAEFTADGVEIVLSNTDQLQPTDILLASDSTDRMTVRAISPGRYAAGPDDVLSPGQISKETLLSAAQIQHGEIYKEIFSGAQMRRYPSLPTLLFWTSQFPLSLQSTEETRRESMTVMAVLLEFEIPPVGSPLTIPATLLPFRAVPDADGSISSAYSNTHANWIARKSATTTLLKFSLPAACRPFQFDDSELQLRILAGSRTVRIEGGPAEQRVEIQTLDSPVGNFTVPLPAAVLNSGADGASVLIRIIVGDLAGSNKDSYNMERDDFWKIERVLMTAKGRRVEAVAGNSTAQKTE